MSDLIAVLGGGSGGHTLAVDLSLRGFDVNLFESPQFAKNFKDVLSKKTICVKGLINGGVKINNATTNIEDAINDANAILVSTPSYGQKPLAKLCAPHVKDQMILVFAANFGSMEFINELRKYGKDNIIVAEANTLPYGCRLVSPGKVSLSIFTPKIYTGVFPSVKTKSAINYFQKLFPSISPVETTLEAALNNPNPLIHPTGMILNAGKIESNEKFIFYDYMTASALKIIQAKERERLAIGKKLGYNLINYEKFSGISENNRCEHFITSGSLAKLKAPKSLDDRYITEDIPYGLVLWSTLAKKIGVETPTIDAEIAIASAMHNVDYMKSGRTLESFGLAKYTVKEIKNFLKQG